MAARRTRRACYGTFWHRRRLRSSNISDGVARTFVANLVEEAVGYQRIRHIVAHHGRRQRRA